MLLGAFSTTMICYIFVRRLKIFNKILYLLLLTETDGSGQLNMSMQHIATSFELVLIIFINALTTI